jgi:glycosyltransferase involved in cell wall biosynthesis
MFALPDPLCRILCLFGFHNRWDAGGVENVCLDCGLGMRSDDERPLLVSVAHQQDRPTKPKLMYVITEDWFFCSHFLERALAARDAGYDVVVMARERAHGQKIRAAGFRLLPVDFDRRSINPVKELVLLLRIYLAYRRERPDVLHHIASKPVLYGSLAAIFLPRKPAIINAPVGMGYVFSSRERLARLLRPLLRVGYHLVMNPGHSRVIFENPDDAADFVKNGGVREADAVVIRGAGIDVSRFHPVNLPAGPPVVALVARMLRDKGVCEFVEAAHRLHDAGVAARFVLVGDPDPENPTSIPLEQLRSWHGHKGVEWWGWRDDMVSTWHQVHIACLPSSYREGLPKALLEAAACGLSIVTTDTVGCREVVRNGDNGLLVPIRDVPALAEALHILISDADLRTRMGKRSRATAEREFSSEQVIGETLAVYRSLADTEASEKKQSPRADAMVARAVRGHEP